MKLSSIFTSSRVVLSVMAGAIAASSAIAAPATPPVAKYVDKFKVVDSRNKTVGFISSYDGDMRFKIGNRFFSTVVRTEGFHSNNIAYYESSDCSGAASFGPRNVDELTSEAPLLIKKNDGYEVYLPDLNQNSPDIEPSATTINSSKNDLSSIIKGYYSTDNECVTIDWSDPNNFFLSNPGQKLRPGILIGKLPFVPPFRLK